MWNWDKNFGNLKKLSIQWQMGSNPIPYTHKPRNFMISYPNFRQLMKVWRVLSVIYILQLAISQHSKVGFGRFLVHYKAVSKYYRKKKLKYINLYSENCAIRSSNATTPFLHSLYSYKKKCILCSCICSCTVCICSLFTTQDIILRWTEAYPH